MGNQNFRHPPEVREKLKELWAEGLPAREIGRRLGGISHDAITGLARRMKLPSRGSAVKALTAEEIQEIRNLRKQGLIAKQIAQKTGRCYNTIYAALDPNLQYQKLCRKVQKNLDTSAAPSIKRSALPLPAGHRDTWGLISNDPFPQIIFGAK